MAQFFHGEGDFSMKKMSQSLIRRCRLSLAKQRMLFALFCAGATARASARAAGVNRNTAARIFRVFRLLIALSRLSFAPFAGRVEIDECYIFGAPGGRKVARQGRCLAGKFAVAGVAQRCPETGARRLKTAVLPAVNRKTLHAFAREHVLPGTEINTDQFRAYDLTRCGFRHKRVNHSLVFKDFRNGACTNIIESAWSVLRRHFSRFCGGYRHNLRLFLAEIEMRFECGVNGFEKSLKKLLKNACVPVAVWKNCLRL